MLFVFFRFFFFFFFFAFLFEFEIERKKTCPKKKYSVGGWVGGWPPRAPSSLVSCSTRCGRRLDSFTTATFPFLGCWFFFFFFFFLCLFSCRMPRYDGKRKKQKQGPRLKKGLQGPASSQAAAASTGTDAFIGFDAFGTSFGSGFSAAPASAAAAGPAAVANTNGGAKAGSGSGSSSSGKINRQRNSDRAAGARRSGVKLPEFYNGDDRDVDFQLKKLAKRDDTTRRKALETLIDTMQQAPRPLLRASLRHVLYEYNRLVLSNDHRIRRLAHELLGCYAGLQQALAKLRSDVLVSLWLGTADPHRVVAAKAERTLRAILPSNAEAVESTGVMQPLVSTLSASDSANIMCSVADLLKTSARGVADRKNLSEEESDKRVARVLRQCLTGLVLLFADQPKSSGIAATTSRDLDEDSSRALMAALRFFKNNDEVLRRSAYRAVGAAFRLMSAAQQSSQANAIAKAVRQLLFSSSSLCCECNVVRVVTSPTL